MRRAVCAALACLLLAGPALAGCGVRPSGVISGVEAPSGPTRAPGPVLYFVLAGAVVAVERAGGADVVATLAAGPDAAESATGLTTEVPASAAPARVQRSSTGIEVDLSGDLARLSPLAVDQIVCTVVAREGLSTRAVTLRGGGQTLERQTCPG
ncbi:hypothetical protein ACOBQX_04625 [Actinokineospora sp. G85]|uniref:hypothetical protein n=1 Tax=Actinokineospora sp. G85 TaxID=3406626 RepID=UPI003C7407DA